MLGLSYPKWLNFLLFQAIWFAAILGRESLEWLVVALLVAHVMLVADLAKELRVVLPCAALGVAVDAVLTLSGVLIFDPAPAILPIPFWLVGIWLAFAGTFLHSMSYLLARPVIAIPAAAIAAPISYLAGMGLGAGFTDDEYEAAGRNYGAKDGPFDSVEELLQLLGMTPALYQRLAPALTVSAPLYLI